MEGLFSSRFTDSRRILGPLRPTSGMRGRFHWSRSKSSNGSRTLPFGFCGELSAFLGTAAQCPSSAAADVTGASSVVALT